MAPPYAIGSRRRKLRVRKARRDDLHQRFQARLRIQIDGEPFVILDVHVQSPSARGASSLSKIKVRNLKTGQVFDKTFRGGDKVEEPNVELRPMQFLYRDDDGFHFMDTQSYDQFALTRRRPRRRSAAT